MRLTFAASSPGLSSEVDASARGSIARDATPGEEAFQFCSVQAWLAHIKPIRKNHALM